MAFLRFKKATVKEKTTQFQRESWVPEEAWAAFDEMRREVRGRYPWTEKAKMLIQNELRLLRDSGHDPEAVLNQSVMMGWRGVFPLKRHRPVATIGQGPELSEEQSERLRAKLRAQGRIH